MNEALDPRLLAGIDDLELAARLIAEGFLFGRHHGQRLGQGIEFAQYRSWEPGESSRRVDWRLFARTDKLFVREAELEADFRVWLLLDTSASMAMRSESGAMDKFHFARLLAAALGHVAHRQDDEIGLIGIGDDSRVLLPAEAGRTQWYQLLTLLNRLAPLGRIETGDHLPANLLDATQGSLVVALSDFYQDTDELQDLLARLATGNRDVLALCLECQDEIDLPMTGPVRFQGLESGLTVQSMPEQVRDRYRQRREDWLAQLRSDCLRRGIAFERVNVDRPLDASLREVLSARLAAA